MRAVWLSCGSLLLVLAAACGDPNAGPRAQGDESSAPAQAAEAVTDDTADEAPVADAAPALACGHESKDCYFNGTGVALLKGHSHSPGCGHAWDRDRWLAVVPCGPIRSSSHHCTAECSDHFRQYDKIVTVYAHSHAAGCGHLWDGVNWLRLAKPHEDPDHPDFGKEPGSE